jgi:hypothetical protein
MTIFALFAFLLALVSAQEMGGAGRIQKLLQNCQECSKARDTLFKDESIIPKDQSVALLVPNNAALEKLMVDSLPPEELKKTARRYILVGDGSAISPEKPLKNLDGEEYPVTKMGDKLTIHGVPVVGQFKTEEQGAMATQAGDSSAKAKIGYFILDGVLPEKMGEQETQAAAPPLPPIATPQPPVTVQPPPITVQPPPAVVEQRPPADAEQRPPADAEQQPPTDDQQQIGKELEKAITQDPQLARFKQILDDPVVREFLPLLQGTPVTFFIPNEDAFRDQSGAEDNALYFFLSHGAFGLFPELNEHVLFVDLTGRVLSVGKNDCNTEMGGSSSSSSSSFSSSFSSSTDGTNTRSDSNMNTNCVEGFHIVNPNANIVGPYKKINELQGYYVVDSSLI